MGNSGDGGLDRNSGDEGDSGVRIGAENSRGSAISMSAGAGAGGLDIPANGELE